MKFADYFNEWLYANDGYYANYKAIGKEGDFYTSVSASKFFGGSIANYIIKRIDANKIDEDSYIIEIGAHRGYLLADIIQFIYTLRPELLKTLKFAIVERFDSLKEIQKEYLKNCFQDTVSIEYFSDLSEISKKCGFIVANEIFDAFPCTLVYKGKEASTKNHTVLWENELSLYTKNISDRYGIEKGEISLGFETFAKTMFDSFEKMEFLTFDYGDIQSRNDFSIRVYKKHQVFPFFEADLKGLFKKSDITYDVNFRHLIDSFEETGFKNEKYSTQLVALSEFGIADLLEILAKNTEYTQYLKEVGKVKTLLNPAFFGERFKMVTFTKNIF